MDKSQLEKARSAKHKARHLLREHPLLRGVGITRDKGSYAVNVNLKRPSAAAEAAIPREIDGVPVTVAFVGDVRRQPAGKARRTGPIRADAKKP